MPAGEIWLGDAVRALTLLGVADPGPVLDLLGLESSAPSEPRPSSTTGPVLVRRPLPTPPPVAGQRPMRPPEPTATGAIRELTGEQHLGRAPDPWAGVEPVLPGPEPLDRATQPPLLPLPAARHVVTALVATERPGRRLDTRAAIRTLARRTTLCELPFRPVTTLLRGVQVLVDEGDGLAPFRADVTQLLALLRDVVGPSGVEVVRFVDSPGDSYRRPEPGTPVLAVTDLGIAGQAALGAGDVQERWRLLAARLREQGSGLVALVPYSPPRWPRALRDVLELVCWDVTTTVRTISGALPVASPAPVAPLPGDGPSARLATVMPGVVALAELLAPAVRVSPELLRRVRLRATELPVDIEADLWFSPLLRASGPTGFSFALDVAAELRERLAERLADPLHRPVVDLVRALMDETHAALPRLLRLEEEVAWLVVAGEHDGLDATLAPAVAALVGTGADSVRFWARQASARLPRVARATASGWVLGQFGGVPDPDTDAEQLLGLPVAAALRALPTEWLLVRRTDDMMELGVLEGSDTVAIEVPRTQPTLLEVLWDGGSARVSVPAGVRVTVPVGPGSVELRTGSGTRYRLDSCATTDPAQACAYVDADRTGILVAADLVVAPRGGTPSVTSVVVDGVEHEAAVVTRTGEVEVLRLDAPLPGARVLRVDSAVPPLVINQEWVGAVHDGHRIEGVIESITAPEDRFAVMILSDDRQSGEYQGMPIMVDGRLHGMVLGYRTAYAVGVPILLEALKQVPRRKHFVTVLAGGWASTLRSGPLDAFGGTLWLVRVHEQHIVLESRLRPLTRLFPDLVDEEAAEALPAVDVTKVLGRLLPALLDGVVLLLDADEAHGLARAVARAGAAPAPEPATTAADFPGLADLQCEASLEVHTGFREHKRDLREIMAPALGPETFAIAGGAAEWVLKAATDSLRRPWREFCSQFGLPEAAPYSAVLQTVLRAALEHPPLSANERRYRPRPTGGYPSDESDDTIRADLARAIPLALESAAVYGSVTDIVAANRTAQDDSPSIAISLAQYLTPPDWIRPDLRDLRFDEPWRDLRERLTDVGAPGFGRALDLAGFIDSFQRLLCIALDAVARTEPGTISTHYRLTEDAIRLIRRDAPVKPTIVEQEDSYQLRMPFPQYAQLIRWAAPRLTAATRVQIENVRRAEAAQATSRAVAVRDLRPRDGRGGYEWDVETAVTATSLNTLEPGDILVVCEGDPAALDFAEWAVEADVAVALLSETSPLDPMAEARWQPLRDNPRFHVFESAGHARLPDRTNTWMLDHAAAYGRPAVVVVADDASAEATALVGKARDRGLPSETFRSRGLPEPS